jgi:NDP-mannose synthase
MVKEFPPLMTAVILAGGKGTRLRPFTTTIPKPLVPVGERPILSILIDQLQAAGVQRVVLALSHMAELIMGVFGDGERHRLRIEYSVEREPLGTVGPLRLLNDLPEHFLVMNGDVLTDLDYRSLLTAHIGSGADLTVATYRRGVASDLGDRHSDAAHRQDHLPDIATWPTAHL